MEKADRTQGEHWQPVAGTGGETGMDPVSV